MAGQHRSHTFAGVDAGLPSKVCGSEAEEEWQEVDWVKWSTGELTVDGDSYLLVFRPSGAAGAVKAKPLGNLVRASAVAPDEEGLTLVVSTSDAIQRLYRLTFQSAKDARDFAKLAEAAEAANAYLVDAKPSGDAASEAASKLKADIRRSLQGRWPLVYGGAELYGPDPCGSAADEVLLGHGAAVLLDPADRSAGVVGSYELLFYGDDAGASDPVRRFAVGPKMRLLKQPADVEEDDGPAILFRLQTGLGAQAHSVSFESVDVGECFARDFCVRQRLMEVSLKTAARGRAAAELKSEIEGLRQQGPCAQLSKVLLGAFALLLLLAALRLGSLYAQGGPAPAVDAYAAVLMDDARMLQGLAADVAVKACELAVGSVPAADLRRCLSAPGDDGRVSSQAVRQCVEMLVTAGYPRSF